LNLSGSEIGSLTAQKEHNFFHQLKSCLTILANEIMCPKVHSSNCHKQFTTKSERSQTTWKLVSYENSLGNQKSKQPKKQTEIISQLLKPNVE
jgi:hypothetical protein